MARRPVLGNNSGKAGAGRLASIAFARARPIRSFVIRAPIAWPTSSQVCISFTPEKQGLTNWATPIQHRFLHSVWGGTTRPRTAPHPDLVF